MMQPLIVIGGVAVPFAASINLQQSLEPVSGVTAETRMMDGSLDVQTCWDVQKYRTAISAEGRFKPGLEAVDFRQPVAIKCIEYLTLTGATVSFALPVGGYRTDSGYTPWAQARIGGELVMTPVSVNDTTGAATLTTVTGADAYRINYYPILTFKCMHQCSRDAASRRYRWNVQGEQV